MFGRSRPIPVRHRGARERGSVTLEISILAPALLLLVFSIVQVSLWSYARSLALGAAQEGVAAGRSYGGVPESGVRRANEFLTSGAGDSLHETEVRARITGSVLTVEVSGRSLSVLPGVAGLPVRQSADGPLEIFTTP
jgi:Flp pilus assembly protein TadG